MRVWRPRFYGGEQRSTDFWEGSRSVLQVTIDESPCSLQISFYVLSPCLKPIRCLFAPLLIKQRCVIACTPGFISAIIKPRQVQSYEDAPSSQNVISLRPLHTPPPPPFPAPLFDYAPPSLHVHARSPDVQESSQYPCTLSPETMDLNKLHISSEPLQPCQRHQGTEHLFNIPNVGCTRVFSSKISNICSCAQASTRSQFLHSCSMSKFGFGARSLGTQSNVKRDTSALHTRVEWD